MRDDREKERERVMGKVREAVGIAGIEADESALERVAAELVTASSAIASAAAGLVEFAEGLRDALGEGVERG